VLLAALLCVARADGDHSKVVTLTAANFDDFVAKTPLSLIEFYAPWCGHCKALAPEYDAAAKELEGNESGKLAKVDCTTERDLCGKYDVSGFPTVKLFRNDGSEPVDYDQARKADAIVKFMIKQSAPAVTDLADADAVKAFGASESVRVVAFVSDENYDAYTKVANSLRNDYVFGIVKNNAEANKAYGVDKTPAIVMLRDFDSGSVTYSGDFTKSDDILSFVRSNSFPLVGMIGPENYAKYLDRGYNFVWVFIELDNEEHKKLILDAITPVAADYRDKLSFVQLDGVKWAEHAKSFGLSGNTPGIVLEDRDNRKNFVFPEADPVTKESFAKFIDGVLTGKIAPTIKSEPEPAENNDPVKVVVGTSFDRIVMDDTKDVFVEFYAPWCGHCKALAPKYEELAKQFADDSTMVVAKIDATANDSPADVQGFPTLILYPAGDKQSPVSYEGDRSVKAMARFLRANGKAGGRPIKEEASTNETEEQEAEGEDALLDDVDFGDDEEGDDLDESVEGETGDSESGSEHDHSHDHGAHGHDHTDEL